MQKFSFLLFIYFLFFLPHSSSSQKIVKCGLTTQFSLLSSSKTSSPDKSILDLLNDINEQLGVSTYMNKSINEGGKKVIISLFTTGTYEDLTNKIKAKKNLFYFTENIKSKGVDFSCYNFRSSTYNISRVVFAEPKLTLCLAIDVINSVEDISNHKSNMEIIERISFLKTQ